MASSGCCRRSAEQRARSRRPGTRRPAGGGHLPQALEPKPQLHDRRGGSINDAVWFADRDAHLSDFVIVVTPEEVSSVRVTTATDEADAPVVAVPGGDLWTAVVFVDDPGFALCGSVPGMTVPETMSPMRVEGFDAEGEPIGCLSSGSDDLGGP